MPGRQAKNPRSLLSDDKSNSYQSFLVLPRYQHMSDLRKINAADPWDLFVAKQEKSKKNNDEKQAMNCFATTLKIIFFCSNG